MISFDDVARSVRLRDVFPPERRIVGPAARWRSSCPIHDGEKLSFSCGRDRNGIDRWSCFACGERGSVIDFVALTRHVTAIEAARILGGTDGPRLSPDQRFDLLETFDHGRRPAWTVFCGACHRTAGVSDQRGERHSLELICQVDHLRAIGWRMSWDAREALCPACADVRRAVERLNSLGARQRAVAAPAAVERPAGRNAGTAGNDTLTRSGGAASGARAGVATGQRPLPAREQHQANGRRLSEPGGTSRKGPTTTTVPR